MYEVGALFWYRLVFLTEILIAEALIVYRLKRRSLFWLRLPLAVLGTYALAFAVPVLEGAFLSSVMYLALFVITICAMKILFDERLIKIVFCGVAAYTLQHIAYELFNLSAVLMGIANVSNVQGSGTFDFVTIPNSDGEMFVSGNPFTIMVYLFIWGMTYFFGYLFIKKRLGDRKDFAEDNKKMFFLAALILFFDVIISSIIAWYSRKDFNRMYVLFLDLFNIFCCIFALYLQFDVDDRGKLQNDLSVIKRLWEEKEEQYKVSKSNIELINLKCHDLKHQIRSIGESGSLDKNVVKEIEDVISIYDSSVKTGNEPLDIILTEKSLYCSRHGVKLCCIIDGKKLAFMSQADLYALFGNIIDNAIEAVEPLDEGKKTISLSIKEVSGFLTINIHNYYNGEIAFENKLPKTTKGDSAYHGYGMKSVRLLCDKYGGEMSIKTENQVFNLNIVFPKTVYARKSTDNEIAIEK
ncbi:MAG: GHKL domain-containing protein [Clostridia bacterium]|nr:GHKL domain-containing protein [Clostridia bacterium]